MYDLKFDNWRTSIIFIDHDPDVITWPIWCTQWLIDVIYLADKQTIVSHVMQATICVAVSHNAVMNRYTRSLPVK